MNRHEQLVCNYEDALFKLLMEGVIEHEGKRIQEEMERLNNDPNFSVPPELDRRCLHTISKIEFRKRASCAGKKIYQVFSKLSMAMVIAVTLFTSAYAAFPALRVSTLNLLIQISDIATEFKFSDTSDINEKTDDDTLSDSLQDDCMTIAGYILPTTITSGFQLEEEGADQLGTWIALVSDNGARITVEVQPGEGNTASINTENAVSIKTISNNQFEAVISKQNNGLIIGGIADSNNVRFILVTFEGLSFDSSVDMVTDFITANMEETK